MTAPRWFSSLAAVLLVTAPIALAGEPPKKPNILHINADDHRADGLGALGTPILQTPNLDTLVERGMTFTRCYTQGSMVGAVCLPSRTMMLSGRSLFRIGGRGAGGGGADPGPGAAGSPAAAAPAAGGRAGLVPIPTVLKSAGYETWHMGKGGNEFKAGLQAFDTNLIDDGKGDGELSGRAYSSRRHAERAIDFLKKRDRSKPFYIYLAPPVPHDPRVAEPQFHALYADASKIPLSPAFMPQHPWDNGEMIVRDEKLAPWPRTPQDTRKQLADYYACITGLDHHIGRIFAALKETGQWENTLIVFTGDNGLSLGEHGLFGKQNLYEFGGMHVPCVFAGPGIPRGRSESLVYLMDLYPTFADIAGAKVPGPIEGRSLQGILKDPQARVRDVLYTAYQKGQRAIRDDRWKLIRYPLVDKTQLFDLATDPRELVNLADRPEHAARVEAMMKMLANEMKAYGDDAPLKVASPAPAEWKPPGAGAPATGAKAKRAARAAR